MKEKPLAVPGTRNTGTNYAHSRYQLPRIDKQRIRDLFLSSPYLLFCAARVGVYSVVQDTVLEIRTEKIRARKRNGGGSWNRLQLRDCGEINRSSLRRRYTSER